MSIGVRHSGQPFGITVTASAHWAQKRECPQVCPSFSCRAFSASPEAGRAESLARPAAAKRLTFCCCFLFIMIFIINDFRQTNYLSIYRTDLCQILRVGRTAVRIINLKLVFRFLRDASEVSAPLKSRPYGSIQICLLLLLLLLFLAHQHKAAGRETRLMMIIIIVAVGTNFAGLFAELSSHRTEFLNFGDQALRCSI